MIVIGMPGGPEFIIFLLLAILAIYVFTLIDIIKSVFDSNITKLIWVLIVVFMPLLGTLLYLAIGRGQRIKKTNQA